ncbi:MAG TPA: alpha/beta hydrolase [Chitinophagaceae bacterium]|nr:alpha/beta hydrolase [Chitinophagaceae bacterium]
MWKQSILWITWFMGAGLPGRAQSAFPSGGHYFSSFDGTSIYYELTGSGSPVLLIHGFMGTGDNWKHIALYRELCLDGFEVICPDLRGNGKSGKPHDAAAYLHDAEARDMMALMDHLGIRSYAVVGYSRGSIIASRLLILDSRVTRIVLGGMGTGFTDTAWARRKMFYRALAGDTVAELAAMIRYVEQKGLDRQALAWQQYGQPSTSPQELSRVRKPVLVICGNKDSDNGSGKALAAMIPGAQFATVPGNHDQAMSAASFSTDVLEFLKGKKVNRTGL